MVEKVIFPTHFKGNGFTAIFIIVEKLRNLLLNGKQPMPAADAYKDHLMMIKPNTKYN